jgi:GT2 family glycosyltransferase
MMQLAIVILNWNAAADTIRCVRHLVAWQRLKPAIWVVDNASSDGSAEIIAHECPFVSLVRSSTNLGFAGGNNRGIIQALAAGDAPILLLNNDALIEETDAIRLLETLQADPRIGFIGPLLFDAEQKDRLLAAGGGSPVKHHHSHFHQFSEASPVFPVTYVPGTAIIGRAEVFRTVGLLDERYFFSAEVADLCLQAGRHGYLSVIDSRARAYHAVGRSSNLRDSLYTYYIIRNRFLMLRKHHRRNLLLFGFWTLYSLALALKLGVSGKSHTAQSVWLGLVDGLQGRFGGQNERVLARVNQPRAGVTSTYQEAKS